MAGSTGSSYLRGGSREVVEAGSWACRRCVGCPGCNRRWQLLPRPWLQLKPFYTFCSLVCSLGGVHSPDVLFTDSLFSCVYSTAKCIYCVLITLDSLLFPCDSFLHIFKLSVKILNREFYVLKLCSIFLLKCLRDVSIICLHMLCFIPFQKVICFLFSEWSILLIKH